MSPGPDTAGNEDFAPNPVEIVFQPGESGPKPVILDVIDDDEIEASERFIVSLSSSSPGVTVGPPANVIIEDDDGNICHLSRYFLKYVV